MSFPITKCGQRNYYRSESMAKLNNEIQVSDVPELSAKIEETSAMAEEMNATAAEIERAIDTIAVKAQEGAESAGEVSKGLMNSGTMP